MQDSGGVLNTELHGHYNLEDVRRHFGLDAPDVLWFNIQLIQND